MISLGFSWFALIYMFVGLSLVLGLWFFYDRREKRNYQLNRFYSAYHCIKCGSIYAQKSHVLDAPCPDCKFNNTKLKF